MTGTLDRIEAKIANEARFPTVVLAKDEAEALVEVAKAAQRDHRHCPDREMDDGSPGCPTCAALARLEDNQ